MTHALTVRGEPFAARDTLPAWALMKLARSQAAGDALQQVTGLHEFLLGVLRDEERERFESFMEAHPDVTFEELETAIGGLMQAYAARPTGRPSPSPAGPPPSGGSSRVVSLSRGTAGADSTSSPAGTPPAS